MLINKSPEGLYLFDLEVSGRRKKRTVQAIVDTGSTDCACTYKVITTLQVRPVDFQIVNMFETKKRRLIYEAQISFDGRSMRVPIIRVEEIASNADFVLGMTVLSNCIFSQEANVMTVKWAMPPGLTL